MARKHFRSARNIMQFLNDMQREIASLQLAAKERWAYADESPEDTILNQYAEIDRIAALWTRGVNEAAKERQAKAEAKAEVKASLKEKNTQLSAYSTKSQSYDSNSRSLANLQEGTSAQRVAAAAEMLDISSNLADATQSVKSAVVSLASLFFAIDKSKQTGPNNALSAKHLLGNLVKYGLLDRKNKVSNSAYWSGDGKTVRVSDHSADANNFNTAENISIVLGRKYAHIALKTNPNVNLAEITYSVRILDAEKARIENLLKDIARFVVTGKFSDTTGAIIKTQFSENAEAQIFEKNKKSSISDRDYLSLAQKYKDGTATEADKAELRKQVDATSEKEAEAFKRADAQRETVSKFGKK